jgi:mRNA interferase MazF
LYRRDDVVLVPTPFATEPSELKARPAVVIQNDIGNRFSANLIVATISSQLPARRYPTDLLLRRGSSEAAGAGLDRDSVVQTDSIATVSKSIVAQLLGRLNPTAVRALDDCLRVSLGLT